MYDGALYERVDDPLFEGLKLIHRFKEAKNKDFEFQWKGSKIPYGLWQQILNFMIWGYETHNSEVHCTLFYNTCTDQWSAIALPQELGGMTVKTIFDEEYQKQRKEYKRPWVELGTIHHHCSSKAFASAVDKEDEKSRDGLHITLGNLNKLPLDIDIRVVFHQILYEVTTIEEWVEYPDWITNIPEEMQEILVPECFLVPDGETEFPQKWKDNCRKPTSRWKQENKTLLGQGPTYYQKKTTSTIPTLPSSTSMSNIPGSKTLDEGLQSQLERKAEKMGYDLEHMIDLVESELLGLALEKNAKRDVHTFVAYCSILGIYEWDLLDILKD